MEGGMEGGGEGGQGCGKEGGEKSNHGAAARRDVGSKARGGETSIWDVMCKERSEKHQSGTSCAKNEARNIKFPWSVICLWIE